jgi:hypothetical protein
MSVLCWNQLITNSENLKIEDNPSIDQPTDTTEDRPVRGRKRAIVNTFGEKKPLKNHILP